jgi:hypothetical protein
LKVKISILNERIKMSSDDVLKGIEENLRLKETEAELRKESAVLRSMLDQDYRV